MTLGEIKIEALKIMFVDIETDYESEDIEILENDEYCKDYLVNMPGAINRCFANMEGRGALPSRSLVLPSDAGDTFGGKTRYDLSALISDCQRIERVVKEDEDGGYDGSVQYFKEGGTLVLSELSEGERYIVIYKPSLERIRSFTPNDTVINIPDTLAALIPYFIKSELLREDEPDEAQEARNWYEGAILEMIPESDNVQTHVKSVYSWEDI